MVTNAIVPVNESHLPAEILAAAESVRENINACISDSTKRAYQRDWADFTRFCDAHSACPLPAAPETIAVYISALANDGKKASTINRRLAAISVTHQSAGMDSPTQSILVRKTHQGIRRRIGVAQQGKSPAMTEDIREMVSSLPEGLRGKRDKALLLVGFSGAFRRSELVALNRDDLEFVREGVKITVLKSKTDQEGEGQIKAIPFSRDEECCPVMALQDWLQSAGISGGAVFCSVNRHGQVGGRLTDKDVARAVKNAAASVGLDEKNYAGHSLRSGLATSAAAAGVSERVIMKTTGHKSERMVRRYIRDGELWRDNASAAVL